MKQAAVIGASRESLHGIKEAQKLGVEVIALDGDPAAAGLAAADKGLVVDISDEEAVLAALKKEPISFVLPVPVGRYLSTLGAVNDALGLRGVSRRAAVLCTDKYEFHRALATAGLRDCYCILAPEGKVTIPEATMPKAALPKVALPKVALPPSYPAILKPRFGSGSRGIFYLQGKKDLEQAQNRLVGCGEDYVLEEAVEGVEYGVDGVVQEDRFGMVLLRKKLLTAPPARQAVGYLSCVEKGEALWERAGRYLERIVGVLGLRDCLLHADLLLRKNGDFFVIELSARPSGHRLHDLFTPLATGVDMAGEFVRYQLGESCCFVPGKIRPMLIRYFNFENCRVEGIPDPKDFILPGGITLVEWQCGIRPGDKMGPVTTGASIMGRGYFILEAKEALKTGEERMPGRQAATFGEARSAALLAAAQNILGQFQLSSI